MESTLPLLELLSRAYVAYTIELDNEFEHRTEHRTSTTRRSGPQAGPWLTSLAMYATCMQHLDEHGVTVRELEERARTRTNLHGMQRWGYIRVEPKPGDPRPNPPGSDRLVRPTRKGAKASEVWRPLFGEIDERWRWRFGTELVDRLRGALASMVERQDRELPDCLPILGYGLYSRGRFPLRTTACDAAPLPFSALLGKVLLEIAIGFETNSSLSLAISANVLESLDNGPLRLRDVPAASGVSKESISMALGILQKGAYVALEPDPLASRGKQVRLTAKGAEALQGYRTDVEKVERSLILRYGAETVGTLYQSLEQIFAQEQALLDGLKPYPECWRAKIRPASRLPRFPMVLHRGGYPDGS
jgi:DNA-binding MarR family transcriptional regulator